MSGLGTKARDVACPVCGAKPHNGCIVSGVRRGMGGYHSERITAAVKVTREANQEARRG